LGQPVLGVTLRINTVHALTGPGQTAQSVKADIERLLASLQRHDSDLRATVEVMAKRWRAW
jgi:hypothetical protein